MICVRAVAVKNSKSVMDSSSGVEVKNSLKHGTGLFVLTSFKKGQAVYSFPVGRKVAPDDIINLTKIEKDHLDKIGDSWEVVSPPGCFVNHSCDPNIEERDRIGYAKRDISRGEELTVDYDQVAYLELPFDCNCGEVDCRKVIKGNRA